MSRKTDILVLGATGFTGRLITKTLNAHRDRTSFTFALGARSSSKLAALVSELELNAQVPLITVDVTKADDVERAVETARVVINTVGPYCKWGTPVVRACAQRGIHYVDITGETTWIEDMIYSFDYLASKTHSVIVHSCGYDSIPSDLSVYLSVSTLKKHLGQDVEAGRSITAHSLKGGISGGTLSTVYTLAAEIPHQKAFGAFRDHSISPAPGAPSPRPKLVYALPYLSPPVVGGAFAMAPVNRAIVLRTRGLHESFDSMKAVTYGSRFTYEEFVVMPSRFVALLLSLSTAVFGIVLVGSSVVRYRPMAFQALRSGSGTGSIGEVTRPLSSGLAVNLIMIARAMEQGFMEATNITSSIPTSTLPETHAKSVIRGRGDPGYLCTAVMITESALALLDTSKLTPLARQGGVLTAVSAYGDELPKRLEASGVFSFESSILRR